MNKHRGIHEEDKSLFLNSELEKLKNAAKDLIWLLDRGYSLNASLKLVGDRFQLKDRQRMALSRIVTSTSDAQERKKKCVKITDIINFPKISIDTFNVLITIESALAGGYIFECFDGSIRDIASVHGRWRKVVETEKAINLICLALKKNNICQLEWVIDLPVSNSKVLAKLIENIAHTHNLFSDIKLLYNSDQFLKQSCNLVATSDSTIIDKVKNWLNLAKEVIVDYLPDIQITKIF